MLADISRDRKNPAPGQPTSAGSGAAAGVVAPTVDTTFRPTAADDNHVPNIHVPSGRVKRTTTVFMFALCSALLAAAWQHYGAAAKQVISAWAPPFVLTSSPPTEPTGLAGQADAPAVQAAATDQAPPPNATAAPLPDDAASVATAPAADAAQLQSMARDLSAMGQQVEQLKASIAALRASQQAMARDVAKPSESKPSETKPSEVKPVVQNPRPKIAAPPPRAAASPPPRRPMPAYAPVQAAAPAPLPQAVLPPASSPPAPPPQATVDRDGEPVMRPPMPLH